MKNNIKIAAVQFTIGNFVFNAFKGKSDLHHDRVIVTVGTDREYFTDFQMGDGKEVATRIAAYCGDRPTAALTNLLNSIK